MQAVIRAALLQGPSLQVPSCSLQHVTAPVGFMGPEVDCNTAPLLDMKMPVS